MRKISEPKRDEVIRTGRNCTLTSSIISTPKKFNSGCQMEEVEACGTNGERKEICVQGFGAES